ncbi:hypothetical protein A5821_002125 [Enterococcus sp. 7F3_DIV0205]|uniref:Uncharacterized protein n=1 Tax=Candidatus Enterococcus palustris TaxID=1834189 RepID=A0AAQ3Y7G0_9ENTE|nr:hypothetical protein [Enterococcus sp. 7F3_DIV0205]OTN82564.1 hypothetical protein A5821_002475 [Enterococcus sp. 7F3_DIV0205]
MKKIIVILGLISLFGLGNLALLPSQAQAAVKVSETIPARRGQYFSANDVNNSRAVNSELVVLKLTKKNANFDLVVGEFDFFGGAGFNNFEKAKLEPVVVPGNVTLTGFYNVKNYKVSKGKWFMFAYVDKSGTIKDYFFLTPEKY